MGYSAIWIDQLRVARQIMFPLIYMVKVPGSNKNRLVNGNLIKNVGQFFGHFQIEKIETAKKILATPPSPNLNL